ncbi:siderophore-interacting protein [Agrobacterium vitis]|uniref:siderophore-interacting protein n=1 Tax=Agrobacterium vitis TaxID=373 RepID=UPI0012E7060E|nr:siderophore-interacting protein [Agrobacterium vitis]MVA37113.1 siderophore-interacting protein [Agrobacterium vitis]
MRHEIFRVRHELIVRSLTVRSRQYVTPMMLRLVLTGPELEGFKSLSADDHIKVFAFDAAGRVERRDYTPRHFDVSRNELTVDFAMHEAGPVTNWARDAVVGDAAKIGGPRGSVILPEDFDWWLLIGDETALPAIGRRLGDLSRGTNVTTMVSVSGPEEEQVFTTKTNHEAVWVHRPLSQADDPSLLMKALENFQMPTGDGFIWIAAEAGVCRALREFVLSVMRHPLQWHRASGYWVKGKADANEKFELT